MILRMLLTLIIVLVFLLIPFYLGTMIATYYQCSSLGSLSVTVLCYAVFYVIIALTVSFNRRILCWLDIPHNQKGGS